MSVPAVIALQQLLGEHIMAEIPIQRKTGTNWVPFVLGAVVIVALLGWCASRNKNDGTVTAAADSTNAAPLPATVPSAPASTGAVAEFATFVTSRDSSGEKEGNHQRTATGIRLLAAALAAVSAAPSASDSGNVPQSTGVGNARGTGAANSGAMGAGAAGAGAGSAAGPGMGVTMYTDSMRVALDRLQNSAATDVHTDDVKSAFSAAVSAMEQVDRAHNRTRDVAPMRAIYNELDTKQPLLTQLATVQRFFEAARDALQGMSTNG